MHKLAQFLTLFTICLVFSGCNVRAQELVTRKSGDSKAIRLYNRGVTYLANRQPAKAIEDFKKAAHLEPNFIDAHIKLGDYYFENKDYSKALASYQRVVELDENYYKRVYYDIGESYFFMKKFDQANEYFEKFLAQERDSEKLNKSAEKLIALGKFRAYHNNRNVPFCLLYTSPSPRDRG